MEQVFLKDLNIELKDIHRDDLLIPAHPTRFVEEDGFNLLFFRFLNVAEEELQGNSVTFLIIGNEVWKFEGGVDDPLTPIENGVAGLIKNIQNRHENNFKILDSYADQVDKLEDLLYERRVPAFFMDVWFDFKKDILKIDRYFTRNINVMNEFKRHCEDVCSNLLELKDLLENLKVQISMTSHQISRLNSLHHYYTSIKSDKLNHNIYMLTLVSGVFLPLNLIVGFFGMNTEGLFFKGNPEGTKLVTLVLFGVAIIFILGLPVVRMLDRFILRFFLGRYQFYNDISGRLDRLGQDIIGRF